LDLDVTKKEPVVIKKYANRRLYNTETSTYVTLEDLAQMVRSERDFVVYDAKNGEDLTRAVLTQIIVEQESQPGAQTMLPIPFLRQLIRFYGDSMQRMVPSYLQVSLETLVREQERFRERFPAAFTPHGAFEAYQDQARRNMELFEQAMSMFRPFQPDGENSDATGGASHHGANGSGEKQKQPPSPEELAELKAQLATMQEKIDKLTR